MPAQVELQRDQQIQVSGDEWPPKPISVDVRRTSAWLRHQIVFDQEPLKQVAAEFNRYAKTPIEIVSSTLSALKISGTFSTDDNEEFIAFLRSLKGVRVEVTATRILVSER